MAFEFVKRIWQRLPQPDPEDKKFYSYSRPASSTLAAIPAAYAAISLLASTLAQLPRIVAKLDDPVDDHWEPEPDHPVSELLRRPSRLVDPWLFWEWMFRCLFTTGNAYAWIRRRSRGDRRPIELVPAYLLHSEWVSGSQGPVAEYDLQLWGGFPGAREERVSTRAGDVLTLHGPGFDGLQSPSPIQYAARRTLEIMDHAAEHQKALLQGVNIRTAITSDASLVNLTREKREELQESIKEAYAGARKPVKFPSCLQDLTYRPQRVSAQPTCN